MKRLGISSVDDLTEDDFIPDYEEVDPVQVEQLRQALKRNSFHKEVVNTTISSSLGLTRNEKYADNTSATKERIMQALIYCIHKVREDDYQRTFIQKRIIYSTTSNIKSFKTKVMQK